MPIVISIFTHLYNLKVCKNGAQLHVERNSTGFHVNESKRSQADNKIVSVVDGVWLQAVHSKGNAMHALVTSGLSKISVRW